MQLGLIFFYGGDIDAVLKGYQFKPSKTENLCPRLCSGSKVQFIFMIGDFFFYLSKNKASLVGNQNFIRKIGLGSSW